MSEPVKSAYSVSGEGPPLFLIHGIGAARDTWRFLLPLLIRHFRVITYDLRGHGETPAPDAEFGLDELVEDLEALRASLDIDTAHFAGHSLGGMIGPAYARRYPNRVRSLGLLSTAAGRSEQDRKNVWAVVHAMEEKGVANVLPTLKDRWYTDRFLEERDDLVQRRMDQVIATDEKIFLNVFRIYAGTEMLPWLGEITQPCLVLTGENDGGCNPRLNRLIDAALPHSELVVLQELKHSVLLENGPLVADHMIRFLTALLA